MRILYIISFLLFIVSSNGITVHTPSDVKAKGNAEVSNVVQELYRSIEYDGSQQPDWALMKSLFMKGAEMVPVTDSSFTKFSVDEFIKLYRDQIESGLIKKATEFEIFKSIDHYQNIAQVFSTYETETITENDTLRKRGINSIQLLKTDGEWKIVSLIWFDENDKYPIPGDYLGM